MADDQDSGSSDRTSRDDEMEKALDALQRHEAEYLERRERSRAHQERLKGRPWKERAEGWLAFEALNPGDFIDAEALVYLRSQGHDCAEEIELMRGMMADGEESSLSTFPHIEQIVRADPRTAIVSRMVPIFWPCALGHEAAYQAALLRAVEWCDIGGFDPWWELIGRDLSCLAGDPIVIGLTLFPLARSSFALKRYGKKMDNLLDDACGDKLPWKHPAADQHLLNISCAAGLLFTACRLPDPAREPFQSKAAEFLLRHQNADGSWNGFVKHGKPSIDTTAEVVHALALARPPAHERAMGRARKWLLSQQRENGPWVERGPDPVYLTVLVLDAIELGGGGSEATFRRPAEEREARRGVPDGGGSDDRGATDPLREDSRSDATLSKSETQISSTRRTEREWNALQGQALAYFIAHPHSSITHIAEVLGIRRQVMYEKGPDGEQRFKRLFLAKKACAAGIEEQRSQIWRGRLAKDPDGRKTTVEAYYIPCYRCGVKTEQLYRQPTGRELCERCERMG